MNKVSNDRQPRWAKWLHMPVAKQWEVVALSLDIEPDEVNHGAGGWMSDTHIFSESQEFKDRLDVVKANRHKINTRPRTINMADPSSSLVGLWDFVQFAKKLNWTLPTELLSILPEDPAAIPQQQVERIQTGAITKPYHSKFLVLALQASTKFWERADRNDKTTHPEQADIIGFLKERDSKLSDAMAKNIASVIRPEWAAVGRKPNSE